MSNKLNILVPTDFSNNASNALNYAVKLYANQYCTFYILHSTFINEAVARAYQSAYSEDNQNRVVIEHSLAEVIKQAKATNANPKHNFEALLSGEELKTAVKNAVQEYNVNMVVMGTKGATGAVEYVMGSNTIKVIRKITECPVLVLPETFSFVEPKQITFPTDYNRSYDEKEIQVLKNLADLYHSKLRIVHINVDLELSEVQENNMVMLKKYLGDYEHSFHWLPDYTTKAKAIAKFVDDLEIDILAMINYKHGILEKILNEPVIKNLTFNPKIPILVIPK